MKYFYILLALLGIILGFALTVQAATSVIPIFGGGTGSAGPFASSTVLVSNGSKIVGYSTSSLGITGGTGLSFGQAWELISGYLTPTTTQVVKLNSGFISTASSTISGNINISGNATATNATTTNLAVLTDASTTNLTVSRALRLSALATGILHSTSGVISSSLIDLVNDVTSVLGIANGGTNASSLSSVNPLAFDGTRITASSSIIVSSLRATSTTASSTFLGGLEAAYLNLTGSSATNTAAKGFNIANGCYAINGTCLGGSGGSGTVTSVGASGPTGLTWSSAVTTSGTLTATLDSGFSLRKLPSYVVGASGSDFTTPQGALDAAGTAGGGSIYLTDSTYAQGATGLTFKSSNTNIYCRNATTTITITGATTAFKSNSAAAAYSNNGIHGCVVTGDGNTSSIAFDLSDMNHFTLEDTITDNVGTWVRGNDTQNVSFYNTIKKNTATTITAFGLNASSTNPWNKNTVVDNFIGCSANCIGIQLTNSNGNTIMGNAMEPNSTTGTVGIKIFNNTLATNDGVFNNNITDNYIEGNATGISVANAVGSGGGIKRNIFTNNTVEANTADYSLGSQVVGLNTFINNYDSNFGNPLTSFQGPVGIATSTELYDINGTAASPLFNIGPNTANGTSTIGMGKYQIDAYNSAGARICGIVNGTTPVWTLGKCTNP